MVGYFTLKILVSLLVHGSLLYINLLSVPAGPQIGWTTVSTSASYNLFDPLIYLQLFIYN